MKRVLFVLMAILLTSGMVYAQQKEAAITVVDSTMYDFGDISEADGPVSHTFTILNNGELPLVIQRVVASCGCTTPEWTKEPIAPGKTGEVKVTYDPKGRPNKFTKPVTIYYNKESGSTGSYTLTIKGNVIPKQS